jgi:hypothetical protein
MTGSDDDRMDEMLIHGARDYNSPGSVPREEMWAAISAARQSERANDAARVGAARSPARRRMWLVPGIGIAAALLLSTGVVIGRRMTQKSGDGQPASSVASVAPSVVRTPATAPAAAGSQAERPSAGASSSPASTVASASTSDTLITQLRNETRRTNATARELAEAPAAGDGDFRRGNTLALQLVVMRHLAGSEAMITSFRSTARRGERDPMMADWSREMLNTTRMLEASRVTDDPVMKRLLDDLDLVISEIVQYATKGTNDPGELDLIEQSINRRGVISKLRSTLPARPMPTGL